MTCPTRSRLCGIFCGVVKFPGQKFRRQHPFGDYILDFVCLENRLVIEIDGGQHVGQTEYEGNRTQKLQSAGFHVIRFWDNEVLKEIESVREKIWLVVRELQSHPPPSLPLEGGGVNKVGPRKGGRVKLPLMEGRGRGLLGNFKSI